MLPILRSEFQRNAPCGTGPSLLRLRPSTCRNLAVNVAIIAPCTAIALVVSDVDVVFGFIGSTMSPLIVFILPALFCEPTSVPCLWCLRPLGSYRDTVASLLLAVLSVAERAYSYECTVPVANLRPRRSL